MTNEEILNSRWKDVDKYLKSYLKEYKKVNINTQDKLQVFFDSLDITYKEINKNVPLDVKKRLDRYIVNLKEKGLICGYFGYIARLIYSRKNVTYKELIKFVINSIYLEENSKMENFDNAYFYDVCERAYEQGLNDIKKIKHNKLNIATFYTILNIPLFDTSIKSYLYSLALTNASELYKQVLINLQLQKDLKVDSKHFIELFDKQINRFININDDKYSGAIVNITESLVNNAYLQAGIDNDVKKCRFINEDDKRTTKMCASLDNQLFYLNKMNTYRRYSDIDGRIVTYRTQGLVLGENLPPIKNHFHWCRSTITYLIDKSFEEVYNITNKEAFFERINIKEVDKKLEEYENDIRYSNKENMIVICPNGTVYRFIGDTDSVTFKNIDLTEAIVTHNHPKEETNYSFDGTDRVFWNNHQEVKILRGIDYKYLYQLNREDNTVDVIALNSLDDITEYDYQHLQNIERAREYKYGYTRKEIKG